MSFTAVMPKNSIRLALLLVLSLLASLMPATTSTSVAHATVQWPGNFSNTGASNAANWRGLSNSADLQRMVVADTGTAAIRRTEDFGTTWVDVSPAFAAGETPYDTTQSWDGNIIQVATTLGVWRSTDAAANWQFTAVVTAPGEAWTSIASSDDGQTVVISTRGETFPHVSTDGGETFTPISFASHEPDTRFGTVSVDGFGYRIVMAVRAGGGTSPGVWVSQTGGTTFSKLTGNDAYSHAVISNNGNTVVGTLVQGRVNAGTVELDVMDFVGGTWGLTPHTTFHSLPVIGLAVSADGARMAHSIQGVGDGRSGMTYGSSNRGASWDLIDSTGVRTDARIDGIGLSRDGYRVAYMYDDGFVPSGLRISTTIESPVIDHGGGTPFSGTTTASVDDPITLRFLNAAVTAGTGTIQLINPNTMSTAATWDVTDTNQVAVADNIVTLTLPQTLAYETTYALLFDPGTFTVGGADYGGINNLVEYRFTTGSEPPPPPPPPVIQEPEVVEPGPPVDETDEPLDDVVEDVEEPDDTDVSEDSEPAPQGTRGVPLPASRPNVPLPPPVVEDMVEEGAAEQPEAVVESDESAEETADQVSDTRAAETDDADPATTHSVAIDELVDGGRLVLPRGTETVRFDADVLLALVATLNRSFAPLDDGVLTVAGRNVTADVDALNPTGVSLARSEVGNTLTFTLQIAGIAIAELNMTVVDARVLTPLALTLLLLSVAGVGLVLMGLRRKNSGRTPSGIAHA